MAEHDLEQESRLVESERFTAEQWKARLIEGLKRRSTEKAEAAPAPDPAAIFADAAADLEFWRAALERVAVALPSGRFDTLETRIAEAVSGLVADALAEARAHLLALPAPDWPGLVAKIEALVAPGCHLEIDETRAVADDARRLASAGFPAAA